MSMGQDAESSPGRSFASSEESTSTSAATTEKPEHMTEADKQILEWAGKLELESMDLREKSSKLLNALRADTGQVQLLIKKLNENLAKSPGTTIGTELGGLIKELDNKMEEKMSSFKDILCKQDTKVNFEKQLDKFSNKMLKSLAKEESKTIHSWEGTQNVLFGVNSQLEGIHKLLTTVSDDIHQLSKRQSVLEEKFQQITFSNKTSINDSINLHGTTLDDSENENLSVPLAEGPITRSKKGRYNVQKPAQLKRKKQQQQKKPIATRQNPRRDIKIARTIIPWEEIDTYYSSEL